jgi:hypothetical protein
VKRIWVFGLILAFSFNFLGIFFVFKIQQYIIRHEIKQQIKQGIPEKELVRITITPELAEKLVWLKDNEFRYHGRMYDVVKKVEDSNHTVVYFCISDNQETELFAHLDDLVKKNMDPEKRPNAPLKNMFKLLSHLYYESNKTEVFNNLPETEKKWYFNDLYADPFLTDLSPPPRG